MNFLEKLDFLMNKFSLTKTTLSQNSGIPYTTIDAWYKKGYEGLKLTTLRKLAHYFNTTLDYWFLDDVTDPNYGKTSGFKVEYDEMEHIKKYRDLDSHGKKMVDFTLNEEWKRSTAENKDSAISVLNEKESSNHLRAQAAHNDYESTLDEQQKMREDLSNLKIPDDEPNDSVDE